jgi:transcriptional regulator with XRE-family HTH domain
MRKEREFVTTQRKLARMVGISESHLSKIKNQRESAGEATVKALSAVTSIPPKVWWSWKIDGQLKKFFAAEKEQYRASLN